jgi:inner membrane protein
MSSYKGHSIFAFILALIFFHNPLTIALTIIGANAPDFDHDFKRENVYKIFSRFFYIIFRLLKI